MNRAIRRFRHLLPFAVLLGLSLQAAPAAALDSRWMPFGPGGGTVTGLAVDPRDSRLFAATFGGLYSSVDGGETWSLLLRTRAVTLVAVDPSHPSTIYAAGRVILRSVDGGLTWQELLDRPDLEVSALAILPGRSPVVLAFNRGAVLRSANGGTTWETAFEVFWTVGSLAVDPKNPANAYLATPEGVFKSSDRGLSWASVLKFDELGFALVAVAPSSPRIVYTVEEAAPGFAVWQSLDGGSTWRRVKVEPGVFERALAVDPENPMKVYLAGTDSVVRSDDGGRIWHPVNKGLTRSLLGHAPPAYSLALDPRHRRTLFAGLYELGVARSNNGGAQWSIPPQLGLSAGSLQVLAFNPQAPDDVYAVITTPGERGLRSRDGGRTWSFLPRQITRLGVFDLAFDPSDAVILYAATRRGVWRSADGGVSWTRLLAGPSVRVATAGPGVLLAAQSCGLLRSVDGGRTWSLTVPCFDAADGLDRIVLRLWTNPAEPNLLYAHVELNNETHPIRNIVLRSTDGGAIWSELALQNPALFVVAPGRSQVLYSFQNRPPKLQASQDGGQTWQVVSDQPPSPAGFYGSLAVDAEDPATIYLGSGDQLFRSRDGGRTLETLDPSAAPFQLITDRARPGSLFIRQFEGGLFERRVEP